MSETAVEVARAETPVGALLVYAWTGRVVVLEFEDRPERRRRALSRRFPRGVLEREGDRAGALPRLARYFAGDLRALDGLPLATGGTPFQERVWAELRRIPPGETVAYAELARRLGAPRAVRAVGLANGANPVALATPCHRLVGSDGSLTGYGGGLERKRWLLAHEGAPPWGSRATPVPSRRATGDTVN